MLPTGKIKIRNLKELQDDNMTSPKNCLTPLRKRKNPKSATKSKHLNMIDHHSDTDAVESTTANSNATLTKTAIKKLLKTAIKETPSNQKRIDSYFTSCPKTYEIKLPKREPLTPFVKTNLKTTAKKTNNKTAGKTRKSPKRPKNGRKRLFSESREPTNESMSELSSLRGSTKVQTECITIVDSDSDVDETNVKNSNLTKENSPPVTQATIADNPVSDVTIAADNTSNSQEFTSCTTNSSLDFGLRMSHTSRGKSTSNKSTTSTASFSRRKPKPCPPYKIIENTTFAVDAFQYGYIENVTHYFLTHFQFHCRSLNR
ncbi:DNA cross-link repair 1A protein [Lucilia cuprina]|nr:DNA cross-link repair 1A protein [Lucilia cuprina]